MGAESKGCPLYLAEILPPHTLLKKKKKRKIHPTTTKGGRSHCYINEHDTEGLKLVLTTENFN